jgi:glycosyltransferase involved in cell wall biosynthesis
VANPRRHCPSPAHGTRRILFLATDAYGGIGGIARFNRDLAEALCQYPEVGEVLVLPRIIPHLPEPTPVNLTLASESSHGRVAYLLSLLRRLHQNPDFDLIICGHMHLLPLARLARAITGAPQVLITHGYEAWSCPSGRPWIARLARKPGYLVSVSKHTLERFHTWAQCPETPGTVLPNTFTPGIFGPGPKPGYLLSRYGITGRPTLLTIGRMNASEGFKGFDEVINLMPQLKALVPGIVYMAVGDGTDRARLRQKADDLGLSRDVIFTGYIPEEEKADHYRAADAFVMPSRGEGFGIVFLEALACGIPVLGSRVDGGRDALMDGQLGLLVDPGDPEETLAGILQVLSRPKGRLSPDLGHFAFPAFAARTHALLRHVWEPANGK